MPKFRCRTGKTLTEISEIETDGLSYPELLLLMQTQHHYKDPCNVLKELDLQARKRVSEFDAVKLLFECNPTLLPGVLDMLLELDKELYELVSKGFAKIVEKKPVEIIKTVDTRGCITLIKLKLLPSDILKLAKKMEVEQQKIQQEEAKKTLALRVRPVILKFLDEAIEFCSLVLGSNLIQINVVRQFTRDCLKEFNLVRVKYESAKDTELGKEDLALTIHKKVREELIILRDMVIEEIQSRKIEIVTKDPIKAFLQQRNNERLLRMLRIEKDEDVRAHEKRLVELRNMVWESLHPLLEVIPLLEKGGKCRLCYRGSLTDGIRNAKKSLSTKDGKVAQLLDIKAFDVDAFIEVPDDVWDDWVKKGFIPEMKKNSKWSLTDLHGHLKFFEKSNEEVAKLFENKDVDLNGKLLLFAEARELRAAVGLIIKSMEQAQSNLTKVPGYKTTNTGLADFSLIIQPARKTSKELVHGKLFDQGSLERSELSLTEVFLRHDKPTEDIGTLLSVVLREVHIEIEDIPPIALDKM